MRIIETVTNEDILEIGRLFLINTVSHIYNYNFLNIERIKYNQMAGCDAEETINIYYDGLVKDAMYNAAGWKNINICIKIVIYDRYNENTYFVGKQRSDNETPFKDNFPLTNHLEVANYLIQNKLIA